MHGQYTITTFDLLVILGALFTNVGGILTLYGPDKFGSCNYGVQVADMVRQIIALILCLIALLITGWHSRS
jgi:hypothetical protein